MTLKNSTRGLCALLILINTACSVSVKDVTAPVALPRQFSQSGQQPPPSQWWRAFNDPLLDVLQTQALSQNFDLQAAFQRLQQARALAIKGGAALTPQLNAAPSASHTASTLSDSDSLFFGFAASYELDVWGRLRATRNAAQLDSLAAQADLASAAISLSAELASTWYKLIEQRQQLQLLTQQIQTNRDNVSLVETRFRGGQASAADVFQQTQLLEAVQGSRLTVLANITVLENQLAVLLGAAPNTQPLPQQARFPDLIALPQTGLSAALMQRRPDVRKAYFAVQAADQRVAAAITDRLPKLSLTVSAGSSGSNLQPLFNNWLATIAGNLLTPLIDGGFRVAEVQRSQAAAAEALNNYASSLLNAVKEVENALIQEQQQARLVTNLTEQVQLAKQANDQLRSRYANGAMDFLRLLSAQLSVQTLERNLLQAKQQLIDYRIALYRALSGDFLSK